MTAPADVQVLEVVAAALNPGMTAPVPALLPDRFAAARLRFQNEIGDHQMTVLHDDGLYRHLRFKNPDNGFYWFDLVTWPGYLSISGDIGCYTFSRTEDMFAFFASGADINPSYWGEKLRADSGYKSFSTDVFVRSVTDYFNDRENDDDPVKRAALWAEIEYEVLDEQYEDAARYALDNFRHEGFEFVDTFDWDLKDFDFFYLMCCFAIRFGITTYRAAQPTTSTSKENTHG